MDIKGQGAVGASGTRAARVSVARGRGVRAARGPRDMSNGVANQGRAGVGRVKW